MITGLNDNWFKEPVQEIDLQIRETELWKLESH